MHFFAFASILLCNICKCSYSLMHLSTYAHIHLCTYSQIHNFRKCTYCICLCIYLYSHFHLFASALNERISDQSDDMNCSFAYSRFCTVTNTFLSDYSFPLSLACIPAYSYSYSHAHYSIMLKYSIAI